MTWKNYVGGPGKPGIWKAKITRHPVVSVGNLSFFHLSVIRPFDMKKPFTKLEVNKPCHWLAGFVYISSANSRVC